MMNSILLLKAQEVSVPKAFTWIKLQLIITAPTCYMPLKKTGENNLQSSANSSASGELELTAVNCSSVNLNEFQFHRGYSPVPSR